MSCREDRPVGARFQQRLEEGDRGDQPRHHEILHQLQERNTDLTGPTILQTFLYLIIFLFICRAFLSATYTMNSGSRSNERKVWGSHTATLARDVLLRQ